MDAQSHYKNHLSYFYSWMFGNYDEAVERQKRLFIEHDIKPITTKLAIDLGAGSGFQSIALEQLGFKVHAVDFSQELLDELKSRSSTVETRLGDIRDFAFAEHLRPELIVCMGDTLSHLESLNDVFDLLQKSYRVLTPGGRCVITYRDLSNCPKELDRFIQVKSDESRILTCFLEDLGNQVKVSDLLHEKHNGIWNLKKSAYLKLKISTTWLHSAMTQQGYEVSRSSLPSGLQLLIGQK
ncbi:MAG TPA: class I SAM-dependent methyltransferase [Bdellovibrio sp.]|uniref:class I SAM-dependent methyltransferase n=1 Tax=Bdellovibrio sp. TaxID=28201 RepID=UPI002F246D5C